MSDFDFAGDSMLEVYLFESTTLLDQLDGILLQSEDENNLSSENVNEIFRIMHTIKGSSAMMEFNVISVVAHKLEDLFYIIREKGIDQTYFLELFDLVLKVSDFLKDEVEKIKTSGDLSEGNDELISEILSLLDRMNGSAPAKASGEADLSDPSPSSDPASSAAAASHPEAADEASPAGENAGEEENAGENPEEGALSQYHLHVRFTADCQMENIRAFMLVNKLETLGKVLRTLPEELNENKDASAVIAENGFFCTLRTGCSREEVEHAALGTLSVESVSFEDRFPDAVPASGAPEDASSDAKTPADAASESGSAEKSASGKTDSSPSSDAGTGNGSRNGANGSASDSASGSSKGKQNLISVDLNKLDALMDLVGEIVITESMVSGNPDLAGLELENFNRAARQLRKLTDELQDIVMSVRMVPVSATFQKMRRIVRDMGKKLDKDVNLLLLGETTEVDKTIIDSIADPIMHLVRNAMDHAMEDRAGRAAARKNPTGQIILSAQNVGGDIIISVSDDGKGLDAEVILAKARSKGLLTKPESEYTEKEIFNLLTMPGFSTKEAVTEFSGRGVGMDVVKKNIEKIGGTVTIESIKGKGTDVIFKIPLTLAIISSMEIKVSDSVYAVPITNIRESFKASSEQLISDPDRNEMIMIRGACYPIIRLHEIFHIEDAVTKIEDGILLLVESGNTLACIFADELLGKHQVVVKPIPVYISKYASRSSGIAGCTIMGDGSISLILDVQRILNGQ